MRFIIKLTKYILKRIIKIYVPDFLFKKMPKEIFIESTKVCNLKYPVCPTTYGDETYKFNHVKNETTYSST